MCLAIPGKIVEMSEEGDCVVDYVAEKRDAKNFMDDIEVGDYVIVSNKVVVMKVPEDDAKQFLEALEKS